MATRQEWAIAYHRQARAEWSLFRELQLRSDVAACHALHYLQMATEKLAKAYRFRDTTTDVDTLLTSHVGFQRFLNSWLLSPQMREEYEGRHAHLERIRRDCEPIARTIERLAPAVDREGRPVNVEYPWEAGEGVVAPVDYAFPEVELLRSPRGRLFLNLVTRAMREFGGGLDGV